MRRLTSTLLRGAAIACLGACSTATTFTSTWTDPDVRQVNLQGKTVAAIFISDNASERTAAEVYLANDLTTRGARGVTGYTLLPGDHGDGQAAMARLTAAGVDGAVVMRVVGQDQKVTLTPGSSPPPYYGGFGRYYNYGWQRTYSPPTVKTDTLVSVETLVYSLRQDKLLWAGTSRTTNPGNLSALVDQVADAVARDIVKRGLVTP